MRESEKIRQIAEAISPEIKKYRSIELTILFYIVWRGGFVIAKDLEQMAGSVGLDTMKLYTLIRDLSDKRLLERSYSLDLRYDYNIKEQHYFPLAFLLLDSYADLCNTIQDHHSRIRSKLRIAKPQEDSRWKMAKAAYEGSSDSLKKVHIPEHARQVDLFYPVCRLQIFWPLLSSLDKNVISSILSSVEDNDLLNDTISPQRFDELSQLVDFVCRTDKDTVWKKVLSDQLAINRFICTGETTVVRCAGSESMWSLAEKAVRALYRRDIDSCLAHFAASLKIRNKYNNDKNLYYHPILCLLLILSYKLAATPQAKTKIQQFTNKKVTRELLPLYPAYFAAMYVDSNPDREAITLRLSRLTLFSSMYSSISQLFAAYFGISPKDIWQKKNIPATPRCAWLRHELQPYFPTADKDSLEEMFGGPPLLASIKAKAGWEYLLEELSDKFASATGVEADTGTSRLVYLMGSYDYSLDILLQTKTKSGKWSPGRHVDSYRLAGLDCEKDEYDKTVAELGRSSLLYPRYVLPYLAGCDRVFYRQPSPGNEISITEEPVRVTLERTGKGFKAVCSMTSEHDMVYQEMTRRIDNLHYTVARLNDKQVLIINSLLSAGTFPAESEKALREFVRRIKGIVDIRIGGDDDQDSLAHTDGSAAITFRVTPRKDRFLADVVVKPLPGGEVTFEPGKGERTYVDSSAEGSFKVTRNLKIERDRLAEVMYFLENEEDAVPDENGLFDFGTGQLLSLLEYVKDNPGKAAVEWPEGKALKFRGTLNSRQVSVRVASGERWLEMEGEVKLDDSSLQLARLLSGISDGVVSGRYVKLGDDDYVALSESLMAQMKRLEAVSQLASKEKARISVFQTGLLADMLRRSGFSTVDSDGKMEKLEQDIKAAANMEVSVPSSLNATLRDYQEAGYKWMCRLDRWGAGACLADDMGLGKTVQATAFLLYKAAEGASLVVAPTSVLLNWKAELERFAPSLRVTNLNGLADRQSALGKAAAGDVFLISYRLLTTEKEHLTAIKWNVACLDEAHAIKNRETATSDAVMSLQATSRIVLTGTPVQNYLGELWNLFQFLNPGLLGSFRQFSSKFINIHGDDATGKRQQLKRIISPFLLRRTKNDVVEELPEKTEITYRVPMSSSERLEYELLREKAKSQAETASRVNMNVLASITKLRQAACDIALVDPSHAGISSKTDALIDLTGEILSGQNRILVFSQFTSYLNIVAAELKKKDIDYFYLDGKVPAAKRAEMVSAFQNGEKQLFLISLKAGGLGLNLTGANYVIHLDPWWNPAVEQQATDRAYRIGQSQNVTVYHLIAENTIEDKILRLHKTKRDLSDAILEGQDTGNAITIEELRELLA